MKLHIMCERDVGLFSLVQQVIGNIPWAIEEGRTPIAFFQDKTCYWTPSGYQGTDTVWEYYFEPLFTSHPASAIPRHIRDIISDNFPSPHDVGYFADKDIFISAHFGDHPALDGKTRPIPYLYDDPDEQLREEAHHIIQRFVRPRSYIQDKADCFLEQFMKDRPVIGVHVRGTDSISEGERRPHRQGSLVLSKYIAEIERLLNTQPKAAIFVATDAQSSLNQLTQAFGDRIIAYDSLRHESGATAGQGPTGWMVPAYIASDRNRAARNGEEAVIECLLLSRCHHLVHNGSSIARTVMLMAPHMPHSNTHHMK